jgi:hypothetical protein
MSIARFIARRASVPNKFVARDPEREKFFSDANRIACVHSPASVRHFVSAQLTRPLFAMCVFIPALGAMVIACVMLNTHTQNENAIAPAQTQVQNTQTPFCCV